jgi:hypothetical protein
MVLRHSIRQCLSSASQTSTIRLRLNEPTEEYAACTFPVFRLASFSSSHYYQTTNNRNESHEPNEQSYETKRIPRRYTIGSTEYLLILITRLVLVGKIRTKEKENSQSNQSGSLIALSTNGDALDPSELPVRIKTRSATVTEA